MVETAAGGGGAMQLHWMDLAVWRLRMCVFGGGGAYMHKYCLSNVVLRAGDSLCKHIQSVNAAAAADIGDRPWFEM
jgi:hypothetical protein